jgi:hypothetical protein
MDKKLIVKELSNFMMDGGYYEEFELEGYDVQIEAEVGGEGDGAPLSYIFEISQGKEVALFRIDGYYSSWDSNQFDDKAYEVEEYIKEVKDWRKVKKHD